MKRWLQLIFVFTFGSIALFSAFKDVNNAPAKHAQQQYADGLQRFAAQIQTLKKAATALDGSTRTVADLRAAHSETRLAFKRIEHLLAYADPEGVKDFINGAPLPSFERASPSLSVLEPEGLQVLDELIFAEAPNETADEIRQKIKALETQFDQIHRFQKQRSFNDRQIFEAMRMQLIRILSLGITGFDTPASLNALPEARASLQGMANTCAPYLEHLDEAQAAQLSAYFAAADKYLAAANDFETFDRLTFIKNSLNPLYGALLKAQLALGIETIYETTPLLQPVNYLAENMFANDFLDPMYYLKIDKTMNNPQVVALGKLLFFDPVLSVNNERACASCHRPELAFTDGRAKSLALNGEGTVSRNAPTVINSIYTERFFHDLRADAFAQQVDHVVFSPQEFATEYGDIVKKLAQSKTYKALFENAFRPYFGEANINKSSITTALSLYVQSLSGYNSDFDRYLRGETDALPDAAKRGFNLFMGKAACGTCHFAPTFAGLVPPYFKESEAEVLGVPATPDTLHPVLDSDKGRYDSKRLKERAPHTEYAFKTSSVRNAALTAPYMHNGVYATLDEVLDFYNRGGGGGMGIDLPHQTLSTDPLGLLPHELNDLKAFMNSLTDTLGMTSAPKSLPAFDDPKLNKRTIGGKY